MDDNSPVHGAQDVENDKAENEITFLKWTAQSPDLNVAENIWLYIKRRLQKSTCDPECMASVRFRQRN